MFLNCCKKKENKYNKLIINKNDLLSIDNYKLFENDCSICLEPLIKYNCIYTLNCKHIFHIKCLKHIFNYNNLKGYSIYCPLCYENQYYLYNNLKILK